MMNDLKKFASFVELILNIYDLLSIGKDLSIFNVGWFDDYSNWIIDVKHNGYWKTKKQFQFMESNPVLVVSSHNNQQVHLIGAFNLVK